MVQVTYRSGGTGKAEDAKLQDAGIILKRWPRKMSGRKRQRTRLKESQKAGNRGSGFKVRKSESGCTLKAPRTCLTGPDSPRRRLRSRGSSATPLLRKGIVRPNRTIERSVSFLPTLEYRAPGSLRQDPDHAASSSPEAKNLRKWETR
jgi:hypothetical protein